MLNNYILNKITHYLVKAFFCALIFLGTFYLLGNISEMIHKKIQLSASKRALYVDSILKTETANVLNQAKDLSDSIAIRNMIENSDRAGLFSVLEGERNKKNIDMILALNKDGLILSGTPPFSERGDFRLHITSWGSEILRREETAAFTEDRFLPLLIIGGIPILRDGDFAGAIISAVKLDGEYAREFSEKNLKNKEKIAFYSIEKGIIGDNFLENERINIHKYFDGAVIMNNGSPDFEIPSEIELAGERFFVRNINFFDSRDKIVGGALLFVPDVRLYENIIFASISVLFLLLLLFVASRYKDAFLSFNILKNKKYVVATVVLVFIAAFFINEDALIKKAALIKKPPYIIYNSTLAFEPSFDTFARSDSHRIAIRVRTGGEAINVAGVIIQYDPKMIEVEEIITENSFCSPSLFIEKSIDNEKGEVNISCGLPSPGFSGIEGTVSELIIRIKEDGNFSLYFGQDTKILANDGFGTDVLRLATDGSYESVNSIWPKEGEYQNRLLVFSSSHPNSEKWYNDKNIFLSWVDFSKCPNNCKYSYLFDGNAGSVPAGENITENRYVNLYAEKEGIGYFHIAPYENGVFGAVKHYRVMIDTTPPLPPVGKVSETKIKKGDIVRITFESQDEISGIQSSFYVNFGSGLYLPVFSPLYLSFIEKGNHVITGRVFDKAGNYSDKSVNIEVMD